ncbi:hypothetical protein DFH09DRAFT_1377898 [Mycena vulgaris]|nr:hypothetical protein DFH09DRAFT_1377898 [Mycena vulgaris]
MVFLNICQLWTNIALSTPSLWTAVQIDSPAAKTFDQLFETWIRRARSLPISLSLTGPWNERVQASVKQHAHRLEDLQLDIESEEIFEHLGKAKFSCLRALKLVAIPQDIIQRLMYFRDSDTCVEMLRAAPGLVECDFVNLYYEDSPWFHHQAPLLTHTSLHHLRLGDPQHSNSACILQQLTLPSLQTLLISHFDISPDDLVSFLERSSPPLESLKIDMGNVREPHVIAACLRLVRSLSDLVLLYPELHNLDVILASDQKILPNLRNLTIWGYFDHPTQYQTLISLITARRASRHSQLQSFRLITTHSSSYAPNTETVAALRQLVEDGMVIHIGPENGNLI